MIINPVRPNGICHGCTVGLMEIIVEPSTIAQWYPQVGSIHEPGGTTQSAVTVPPAVPASTSSTPFSTAAQSAGLAPMAQGSGVLANPGLLSTGQRQGLPSQDGRRKRRKVETHDKRIVSQEVGA